MLRFTKFLFVAIALCAAAPASALELGTLVVGSRPGQILDAKIILLDTDTARLQTWHPIPASADDYRAHNLDYIPSLHSRIVMETVLTDDPPYIAVSSIGAVSQRAFDLLVQISNNTQHLSRPYRLSLKEPISFEPAPAKVMTPAETLSYLLAQLAGGEVSMQVVLATLKETVDAETNQAGQKRLILRFSSPHLDESFIAGIRAMLSEQRVATFDHIRANTNDAQAVNDILFAQQDFSVLKKLLHAATISFLTEDANSEQQLEFIKERVAVLENKLSELEYTLARQPDKGSTIEPTINRSLYAWLVSRQWDDPRSWLTRPVWAVVTLFWAILLFFFIWRRPGPKDQVRRPLPGELELQKLRGHRARLDLATIESAMESELNQATAYIAMGEYDEASALLKKVKKQGNESDIQRANELYEKINR